MNSLIDMSRRLRISEQPQPVEWLAAQYANGDIYVPECQRLWSWTGAIGLRKMQGLVDSVMYGYPIPSVILNRRRDRRFEVYDGRHRIETFCKYRNNEFRWNDTLYRDLPEADRERFDTRSVPVTVTTEATEEQLADAFMRLNAGVPLTDSDKLWARRSSPIVDATRRLLLENELLSTALGGINLQNRKDLANWTAIVAGIVTNNPGNMTTSYVRLSTLLDTQVNEDAVLTSVNALCDVLTRANERFPTTNTEKKQLKKIGRFIAFFLAEFMRIPTNDTIEKWVGVIGRLRGTERERREMNAALTTTGAQNLTVTKIERVLDQVNRLLGGGIVDEPVMPLDNDSDTD